MEQNLSVRERNLRLAAGIAFELGALLMYLRDAGLLPVLILGFAGVGFIANYFTCFCAVKKLVSGLRKGK